MKFLRLCWSTCKWGSLFLLVSAALGALFLYYRLDDEVRRQVESRLGMQYPELEVSVRSARLVPGQGIEIRGLSIVDPKLSGAAAQLYFSEEVSLQGNTDWAQLLEGELSIRNVVVRRPTLRNTRLKDGSWSAARLLPLPRLSKDPPRGTIEDGVIEVHDPLKAQGGTMVLRDIDLQFSPDRSAKPGADGRPMVHVIGRLMSDYVRRIDLDASFDPAGGGWSAAGDVEGMEFSPELTRTLPNELSRHLVELASLRTEVKGRFAVRPDAAGGKLSFEASGQINRGRLDDPRLPYPLTDLKGTFRLDRGGFSLQELTGRNGRTTLRLVELRRDGYARNSPLKLTAEGRQVPLDAHLASFLPADLQTQWQKFEPEGEANIDLRLVYDGRTWQPDVTVDCQNTAFAYYKFPYRLERASGRIACKDRLLTLDLRAYSAGEPLRIAGRWRDPGPRATGWLEVQGDNLQLDDKLFAALERLDRKTQSQIARLHARGTFHVFFRFWQDDLRKPAAHKRLQLTFADCSLRHDDFPYRLDNIRGTITMHDDVWHFGPREFGPLEGSNDTGLVKCHGSLTSGLPGSDLTLHFEATGVPLEEELREALAVHMPGAARLWRDLKPRGTIALAADLHFGPNGAKPTVRVTAQPLFSSESGLAASIEPRCFPYLLDNLRGRFSYEDGRLTFSGVRAEHRGTRLRASGWCDLDDRGGWRVVLKQLQVDHLRPTDRDLVQALPGRLKKIAMDLRPQGFINVAGSMVVASSGAASDALSARWNLTNVDCQLASIDCGVVLDEVHGKLSLAGEYDGRAHFRCGGELDLDSVMFKDFQFTAVLGPFTVDDDRVLLGLQPRPRRDGSTDSLPRPITGRLLGGTVRALGTAYLGPEPQFAMNIALTNADLDRFAQEAMSGRQELSGQVSADIELTGSGRGLHNLGGRGNVRLRDARLGQLPVMAALLKTLSGRLPDTTAFNTADLGFRIQGEHVYLNDVHFQGDAISLRGEGEMGFDRTIHLTFYSLVGRDNLRLPILDMVVGGASQQILQIHVDGTLDNPETRREVLPAVAQTLQALQLDPQARTSGRTRPTAARPSARP